MHVRCPHCQNPIDIVADHDLKGIECPSCGSNFNLLHETESWSPTPQWLDHFQLLDKLGTGGFGTVWKAKDTKLDRLVAVKIPRRAQVSPAEEEQFLREARAAAQLRHPSIVAVHEVGRQESGDLYIVSDFVQGATLADRLTAGPFTPREATELTAQIADALHHAHEQGVIHRDLKPSNIMLERSELVSGGVVSGGNADATHHSQLTTHSRAKLLDFGLAKREAGEITMTIEGKVLGTPAYMSPEQARGDAHKVDRRTDVYSLGVILFELLTGELPFRGNTRMLLDQVLHDDPPSPRKFNSRIPRDLETICLKCLEKDPRRRYPTAADVRSELRRYLDGKPIVARPISPAERSWRWCRRNPLAAAIAVLFIVLAVVGPIVAANQAQLRDRESRARRQLQHHLYIADMNRVQHAYDEANIARARELLERYLPKPGTEDSRGFEWYHFWQKCHPEVQVFDAKSPIVCLAHSDDGQMVAIGTSARTIQIWNPTTLQMLRSLHGHQGVVRSVAFSGDGKFLASGSDDQSVRLWDTITGEPLVTLNGHRAPVFAVAFTPDSETLISGGFDRALNLWKVSDPAGQPKSTITCPRAITSLAVARKSTLVAIGMRASGFQVVDIESGKTKFAQFRSAPIYCAVAFSPDGMTLAESDRDIRLWDVATGTLKARIQHPRHVQTVAFSRDGQILASGGYDHVIRLWTVPAGQLVASYKEHSDWVNSLQFSPDGSALTSASDDGTVAFWKVAPGYRNLQAHRGAISAVTFSPSGKLLASASTDGTIKLWDAKTGLVHRTLRHGAGLDSASFSPDDKLLASATLDGSEVKLWNADTGELDAVLKGNSVAPAVKRQGSHHRKVAFSPDSKTIASPGMDWSIELWDVATRKQTTTLRGHSGFAHCVAFSPRGDILASGGADGTVRLWDGVSGQSLATLTGHRRAVWFLAFSQNGDILASAGQDHTVKLWSTSSYKQVGALQGHSDQVTSVSFHPDGKTLASASVDYTIKLWDLATTDEKATFHGHTNVVRSVAFSPDGLTLASGGFDQTLRLWLTLDSVEAGQRYGPSEQFLIDPRN